MKQRVAVFVSGGGTNLQTLLDAQADGRLQSGEIALVIASKEGVFALERARQAGVPAVVVARAKMLLEEFEARCLALLTEYQIDYIALAGFLTVLSADFIDRWPHKIINVHPALIPSFCGKGFFGLRVHEAALEYGVKVTGATVHFVNEVCDGGDIILQKAVEVLPGASAVLAALVAAGFEAEGFYFGGFLPRKEGRRRALLQALEEGLAAL
ncbi:MAG: phosphoribosylglycinamide formyltransferase, partial [Oscillospiraceae bacterium]|nr:phosphoribosylglycinamide formyltransferase [Oscillospiraceae bacterium]